MIDHKTTDGFTLVEMVLVLILTAILATTLISRFPGKIINVGAAADQVAGDIRYVQSLSMTQGRRYRINLTSTSYTMVDTSTGLPVPHPGTGTTAITLPSGITMSWTNLPNSYVAFDGRGIPYTSSTASLAANADISLTSDTNETRTVRVHPETGLARLQ